MEDETKTLGICLKRSLLFPQVAMEFCISSMDPHLYGHGYAQILHLYDIDLRCMSGSYVQV